MRQGSICKFTLVFITLFLFQVISTTSYAQCWYYTITNSTGNTYTALSSPTQLIGGSQDEVISSSAPIGFTFTYNGIDYTAFKVSSNGFVNLGGALTDPYYMNDLSSSSKKEILAPLWDDLEVNSGGSIGYELTGSSGSYILKIEFKDVDHFGYGTSMNFQVWLYEATYEIEFRYGDMGTWSGRTASIGINDESDYRFFSINPGTAPSSSIYTVYNEIATSDSISPGTKYSFNKGGDWYWWKGTTSTDWATTSNWYGGTLPTTSQYVTVSRDKAYYPVVDEAATCYELNIGNGAKVTVNTGAVITVDNDLRVGGLASGEFEMNGGIVNVAGNFLSSGDCTVDINGGDLNIAGYWASDFSDSYARGIIELSGGDISTGYSCFFSPTDLSGTMEGNFTLSVDGDLEINSSTWGIPTGGEVIMTGALNGYAFIYSANDSNDIVAYDLTFNGSGSDFYMTATYDENSQGVHVYNNMTVTAGAVETIDGYGQADKIDIDGTLSIASGATFKNAVESTDVYSVNAYSLDVSSTYELYGITQDIPVTTFGNLTIGRSGTKTVVGSTNVQGTLFLPIGGVDLNGNIIDLGTTGTLSETGGLVRGASGHIEATRDLNAPSADNMAGLGAEITSSANLGTTVIKRSHAPPSGGIKRIFDISPANNSSLNATLTFHYHESELNGCDEADLLLYRSVDDGANWTEMGGTVNTTNDEVSLSGISSFSWWSTGDSDTPMPIELVGFSGNCIGNNQIALNWVTASETNNSHFEIQQSLNGKDFISIAEVAGAGNSSQLVNYDYLLENIISLGYFRLKQVDFDGQYSFSEIISVNCEEDELIQLDVCPNPFSEEVFVNLSSQSQEKFQLTVHDLLGSLVYTTEIESSNNVQKLELSPNLPVGVFFITLSNGQETFVKRLIKQ